MAYHGYFYESITDNSILESLEKKIRKPSTPEFKDWVGYSKVPLQYHATDNEGFTEFDMHRSDLGAHVGTLEQAQKRMSTKGGTGSIMKFWVNIRNPIRLKDEGSFNANAISGQLLRRGIISKELATEINLAGYKGDRKYNEIVRNKLISLGYDGVVYKNENEGSGDSYIIIDPTTIKSADRNSGKFDRNSPDFTQESIDL